MDDSLLLRKKGEAAEIIQLEKETYKFKAYGMIGKGILFRLLKYGGKGRKTASKIEIKWAQKFYLLIFQ
jgi:hypothetical protein